MKNTLILFMLIFSITAYANENKSYIIDVRSAEEFKADHIKGAIHIPYQEIGDKISGYVPSKGDNITLYCARGGRAGKALTSLEKLGYTNVKNGGGINDLRKTLKQKLPLEK